MNMNFLKRIKTCDSIVIYGENEYINKIKTYISMIDKSIQIEKIIDISLLNRSFDLKLAAHNKEIPEFSKKQMIIIAVSLKYHNMIKQQLLELNINNTIFYTPQLDNILKKEYLKKYFKSIGKEYSIIYDMKKKDIVKKNNIVVYVVKSAVDKRMNSDIRETSYLKIIQAGAGLTDKILSDLRDNVGDNISEKNSQYCELTAIYWLWKNSLKDYVGVCHYRRHFVALDEIVKIVNSNNIDVILPDCTILTEKVEIEYFNRYIPDVFEIMMEVLKKYDIEYYEASIQIYKYNYYYACNMWILKRNVLNDLCTWMFPMLEEIEKKVGEFENSYYNRYIGFCAEILSSLYFIYNKKRWNIYHAEKIFIN